MLAYVFGYIWPLVGFYVFLLDCFPMGEIDVLLYLLQLYPFLANHQLGQNLLINLPLSKPSFEANSCRIYAFHTPPMVLGQILVTLMKKPSYDDKCNQMVI